MLWLWIPRALFAGEVIKRGAREPLCSLLDGVSKVSAIFFFGKKWMFYMRRGMKMFNIQSHTAKETCVIERQTG